MSFRSIGKGIPTLIFLVHNFTYLLLLVWASLPRQAVAGHACLHPPPMAALICSSSNEAGKMPEHNRPKYFKEQRMILVTDACFRVQLCNWKEIVLHSKISGLAGPKETKKFSLLYETTSKGRRCSQDRDTKTKWESLCLLEAPCLNPFH